MTVLCGFEILDAKGLVINRVVASAEFVEAHYPGSWVLIGEIPGTDLVERTPVVPVPHLYAAAQLRVLDGDVTGIGINSRFAGAFWGDVGKYYVFFAEPQPDTAYIATADGGPCRAYILDADKAEDFFIITSTDQAGQPIDAEVVNISIVRAS
jgi:hypothetical protein